MNASNPVPTPTRPKLAELGRYQSAIESQILPKLLIAHRAGAVPPSLGAAVGRVLDEAQIVEFCRMLRGEDDAPAGEFVDALLEEGVTPEVIYLDLLAPAARLLGTYWEEDTCDFVAVTIALGRMQAALRGLSSLFLAAGPGGPPTRRVLLGCLPGEQHTLGLLIVAEFFVRAGWGVRLGEPVQVGEGPTAVRAERFDVVGFSVACDSKLSAVKRHIAEVRRASRNREIRVMVGGRVFDGRPELVRRVGADASASDAREAPAVAERLLG